MAFFFDGKHLFHERDRLVQLEPISYVFRQDGGCKRAEALAALDLRIELVLGIAAAGIDEDAASTQGTRAELCPAAEPADHGSADEGIGHPVVKLGIRCDAFEGHALGLEVVGYGVVGAAAARVGTENRCRAGTLEVLVDVVLGGAHGNTGVVAGRGDVHFLKRRVAGDLSVGDAVLGYTSCDAYPGQAGERMQAAQDVEDDFLCVALHGSGQVLVVLGQGLTRLPGGTEALH